MISVIYEYSKKYDFKREYNFKIVGHKTSNGTFFLSVMPKIEFQGLKQQRISLPIFFSVIAV